MFGELEDVVAVLEVLRVKVRAYKCLGEVTVRITLRVRVCIRGAFLEALFGLEVPGTGRLW